MIHPTHILCHYAEIALKGRNRGFFEAKLKQNLALHFKLRLPGALQRIKRLKGRFLLELTPAGQDKIEKVIEVLSTIPGIANFAPAIRVEPDLDAVQSQAVAILENLEYDSFRVTTRKAYSNFPNSKHSVNEIVGAKLVETYHKKVNLSAPDLTCHIDFLYNSAWLYTDKIPGIGGLPVGGSSSVCVMLSGGIDSPVAAYYAIRRGTRAIFVHFHSVPRVSPASIEKVRRTVEILRKYQPKATLYLVEFAPVQDEIFAQCDPRLLVLLYRRFMVRVTNRIASTVNAKAIVTGESIGQVASQTLENIAVVDAVSELPILRPVIGFDKVDIIRDAKKIGTYDISIEPHQDCCTLYIPDNPATMANLEDVEREESKLDIDRLVEEAVNLAAIERY